MIQAGNLWGWDKRSSLKFGKFGKIEKFLKNRKNSDNGDLEVDSSGQSLRQGQKDGNCDWDARVGKTGL